MVNSWTRESKKFEKNFNKLLNSNYAISMNSCTSALECAIKCLKKGEIIVPSFTCFKCKCNN